VLIYYIQIKFLSMSVYSIFLILFSLCFVCLQAGVLLTSYYQLALSGPTAISLATSNGDIVETHLISYCMQTGGVINAATWDGTTAYFKISAGQQWEVSDSSLTWLAQLTTNRRGLLEGVVYRGYGVPLATNVSLNINLPDNQSYEAKEEASLHTFTKYIADNVAPEDWDKSVGLWYPDRPQNQLEVGLLAGSDKIYHIDNGDAAEPSCVMFLVGTTAHVRKE